MHCQKPDFGIDNQSNVILWQRLTCLKERVSPIFGNWVEYGILDLSSSVVEKNVVFEFNKELVRANVVLWRNSVLEGVLWKEVESFLPGLIQSKIRDFAKEARYKNNDTIRKVLGVMGFFFFLVLLREEAL